MTRDKAIKELIDFRDGCDTEDPYMLEAVEALDMAIEALGEDTDVPSNDLISRQAAIDALDSFILDETTTLQGDTVREVLEALPSAQPESCEYCNEDSDGYVKPIEKNNHAFVRFGMDGWELSLKAKGWRGSAKIMYCPMCGRELKHG